MAPGASPRCRLPGTQPDGNPDAIELRFGLKGDAPSTHDEVGRAFNVTRERIRQIENQSLKKLRMYADAEKLRDVA